MIPLHRTFDGKVYARYAVTGRLKAQKLKDKLHTQGFLARVVEYPIVGKNRVYVVYYRRR